MEEAFAIVLFVVVGVAAVIALITFAGSGRTYREIGRGGLSLGDDDPAEETPPRAPGPGSFAGPPETEAEREEEIRQLLRARNERRRRRGEAPLDVDAELARLTAPAVDPALRDEVRQHVVARNRRRLRAGDEPLDVEAEVERRLRELS